MSVKKKKAKPLRQPARKGPLRQRQRLIDACISALHIHGPSRTTVGKVVAFAKMSPGIVRFYFDSKAALLVASLQYLATEFEQQVLVPVAKLKSTPVVALQLMVDLFLDADFASPRKVSAWYTFWGEASSRQEYYDICGQKDESFALLVHELIAALIVETRQPHLDADGIALGLIGVLEILWQDIAFQTERDIDRPAAKRRCMAYLRSIFPGRFDPASAGSAQPAVEPASEPPRFAAWVYADAQLPGQERDALFAASWTVVGHACQVFRGGDFFTVDTGTERALVVRGATGALHALRNSCPVSPHELQVERAGRFDGAIACRAHGLSFSPAELTALEVQSVNGLLCVRTPQPAGDATPAPRSWFDVMPIGALMTATPPLEINVQADWKMVVEQWLATAPPDAVRADSLSLVWYHPAPTSGWSMARYRSLGGRLPQARTWRRHFISPNQLLETRPDGLSVLQVFPTSAGHSLVRRMDYSLLLLNDVAHGLQYLARRLGPYARRSTLALAESTQKGVVEFGYGTESDRPVAPPVAWFRRLLAARLPVLRLDRPPASER